MIKMNPTAPYLQKSINPCKKELTPQKHIGTACPQYRPTWDISADLTPHLELELPTFWAVGHKL